MSYCTAATDFKADYDMTVNDFLGAGHRRRSSKLVFFVLVRARKLNKTLYFFFLEIFLPSL